jgi:hypothetical protein
LEIFGETFIRKALKEFKSKIKRCPNGTAARQAHWIQKYLLDEGH